LTPAHEASAIFRRKAIYEELHPETKAGASQAIGMNKALGRGDVSANFAPTFTEATASATGKSQRSIELADQRAKALGDDLAAVTGTSLGKGVELDALAKLPKEERKGVIDRAVMLDPSNLDSLDYHL
jgi:ParB family chromosome partitioning protein